MSSLATSASEAGGDEPPKIYRLEIVGGPYLLPKFPLVSGWVHDPPIAGSETTGVVVEGAQRHLVVAVHPPTPLSDGVAVEGLPLAQVDAQRGDSGSTVVTLVVDEGPGWAWIDQPEAEHDLEGFAAVAVVRAAHAWDPFRNLVIRSATRRALVTLDYVNPHWQAEVMLVDGGVPTTLPRADVRAAIRESWRARLTTGSVSNLSLVPPSKSVGAAPWPGLVVVRRIAMAWYVVVLTFDQDRLWFLRPNGEIVVVVWDDLRRARDVPEETAHRVVLDPAEYAVVLAAIGSPSTLTMAEARVVEELHALLAP